MTTRDKAILALDNLPESKFKKAYALYYNGSPVDIGGKRIYANPGVIKSLLLRYLTGPGNGVLDPDNPTVFMVPFDNAQEAKDFIKEMLITGTLEIKELTI